MSVLQRRSYLALVTMVGLFIGILAFAGVNTVLESSADAARAVKHPICHRTRATTNPYRFITVSRNSIFNIGNGDFKSGHANHTGPIYSSGASSWGDVIPSYQWVSGQTRTSDFLNWTGSHNPDGTPIFNPPASCVAMTTAQFMNYQSGAGATVEEIMDDLEGQEAIEDLAVKKALGGSFSGWYDNEVANGRTPSISDATSAVQAAQPVVETKPAGDLASTTATLKAQVDPQGSMMTFYFQYGSILANVTSSAAVTANMKIDGVSGTTSQASSPVQVTLPVTGLSPATTYYFRIVGEVSTVDSAGDTVVAEYVGEILQFQVGAASVTTNIESDVTRTTAQLNGEAMPNGVSHVFSFEYSLDSNMSSSTTISAQSVAGSAGDTSGASNPVTVSASLTGLTPNTTYHYRIIGIGSSTLLGSIESFTTLGNPTGSTTPESNVTQTSATLNGTVNPNGVQTDLYFQWATSSAGVASAPTTSAGMSIGGSANTTTSASVAPQSVSMNITGLTAGTTYYYRLVGYLSSNGTPAFEGLNEVFTTLNDPTGTTEPETGVTQTSATLRGTVTPSGVLTELYFQWATTSAGVTNSAEVNTGMSVGNSSNTTTSASMSSQNVSMPISGLIAGTTYYFRLIGKVAGTIVFRGVIEDFTTNGSGNNNNNNQGPPAFVPPGSTSNAPTTTVGRQGPPASVSGGGGNRGGGTNGGPPVTDPRTGNDDPIENNVIVQVGPTLPSGGGGGNGGGGGGSLRIAPQPNEPGLELLDANIEDPEYEIEVVRSGTDYNKPETWVKDGFGDECWKIEPGGYTYVLPAAPAPPSGKTGGVYSLIKVKAGSLTSDDPNFQVNTLFLDPAPGTMVWADSNKDGVSNPGGRTGDKEISHIILCVKFGGSSTPTTAVPAAPTSTTAAPTTTAAPGTPNTTAAPTTTAAPGTPTTSSPNTTAAPTTTAAPGAPTTTAAPTTAAPAVPTTSVPESTEEIEVVVRRVQSFSDGSTTTSSTSADGSRTRKIRLKVTNGFKESTLELEVDLTRFALTGGNVPLPQLPKTGSSSNQPIQLALATIAFGAFLVVVRRRLRVV